MLKKSNFIGVNDFNIIGSYLLENFREASIQMTDLKTNISYGLLPQQMNNPGVVPVKEISQKNPVGRAAGDVTEDQKGTLFGFLYGAIIAGGAFLLNNFLISGDRLEKFISEKIDGNNTLKRASTSFENFWKNGVKENSVVKAFTKPFKGIVKHFKDNWNVVQPINKMAVIMSRPKTGQMVDSLINALIKPLEKSRSQIKKAAKGIIPDIDELLKDERNINQIRETLSKHGKLKDKKVLNAVKTLQREGFQLMRLEKLMEKWSKNRAYNWKDALKEIRSIIGKNVPENLKSLMGQINVSGNAASKKGTIFSRATRGLYTQINDYFNLHNIINGKWLGPLMTIGSAFFLGKTIYDTQKAEKGDKLPTFMEGFIGDVIPFALMDKTMQSVYGVTGGLQKAGLKLNNAGEVIKKLKLLAPVRSLGNFLGIGLKEGASRAARIFGGTTRFALIMALFTLTSSIAMKFSHKLFGKSQKTIEEERKAEEEKKQREQEKMMEKQGITPPVETVQNNFTLPTITSKNTAPAPLVETYISQLRRPVANSPLSGRGIGNNVLTPPRTSYYAEPEPIYSSERVKDAQLNTVLSKIDRLTQGYS